ncbi:hypothetical protein [Saccharibacillus brassicae]|uniref:Uncharacterized protein n=1 Tax=Saccharibacillus brassicae TaxID=2583377 RepID=A0A4Y6UTT9_SACBS|nr:hypothetical protein [Saccharibacillus brassicae]QDH19786.1 hypothetical protein FFV09_02235 [Saccharibacillus brassicae]
MKPIKVVDSIMGSGKSTASINLMNNSNYYTKYMYITPFLDEIDRVKKECSNRYFYSPENYDKDGKFRYKMDSFIELLSEGKDIAATHALFKEISPKTTELIQAAGYTLILDEVMDVIDDLPVSKSDQVLLIDNNIWMKDKKGFVSWNMKNEKARDYEGRFADLKRMSLNRNIVPYSNKMMIWTFPYEVFHAFTECYVLTYLFDAQIQKHYFDLHHIPYEKYTVQLDEFSETFHEFVKGENNQKELEIRQQLKEKIHIYEGCLNKIGEGDTRFYSDLSKGWYKKKKHLHQILKNNVDNYFRNIMKAKAGDVIWTTFKDYKEKIGPRYKKHFLACNIRATNEYKDRTCIAYTLNRYMRPITVNYFGKHDIIVNQDLWAVSEMIQFVWRSAIREGNDIHIYIPSRRMRTLFMDWLEGEDIEFTTSIPDGVADDDE